MSRTQSITQWWCPHPRRCCTRGLIGTLSLAGLLVATAGCRTPDTNSSADIVEPQSAAEFQQIIASHRPVMAVFISEGCGSCRLIGPTLATLAQDYRGRVTVVRADLGLMGTFISDYNLAKVPTVIVFRNGRELDRRLGVLPAPFMHGFIDKALSQQAKP